MNPSTATLYRAAVAFGIQETQLIWNRYAGFLAIFGFLTHVLSTDKWITEPAAWLFVGAIGLFLATVWHVLNFSGWQNQNIFYHTAHHVVVQLHNKSTAQLLPTNLFEALFPPKGHIYLLAQSVPVLFSFCATYCLYVGLLQSRLVPVYCASMLSATAWIICAVTAVLWEHCKIAEEAKMRKLA